MASANTAAPSVQVEFYDHVNAEQCRLTVAESEGGEQMILTLRTESGVTTRTTFSYPVWNAFLAALALSNVGASRVKVR